MSRFNDLAAHSRAEFQRDDARGAWPALVMVAGVMVKVEVEAEAEVEAAARRALLAVLAMQNRIAAMHNYFESCRVTDMRQRKQHR
jgi:hypothetical protein